MSIEDRLARAKYRAWHRGSREADYLVGGFFDAHYAGWDEAALGWFEALIEEQDADIMAWAMQAQPVPATFAGPQMDAMQRLDYVRV